MRTLVFRLILSCVAIYVTHRWVNGVGLTPGWDWLDLVLIGVVFGLLNALAKPIMVVFSVPLLVISLGLFYVVINALILWMTAGLSSVLYVSGFWAAVKGSIVISLVNWFLTWLLGLD